MEPMKNQQKKPDSPVGTQAIGSKKPKIAGKRRRKSKREILPISAVKRLISLEGNIRVRPKVIKMTIDYLVKVARNMAREAEKLARESKRSTIFERDMEKVLKFDPYCRL